MIEQYHASAQDRARSYHAAISAREETTQHHYLCATYRNYTH